jgi:hypothetical protein
MSHLRLYVECERAAQRRVVGTRGHAGRDRGALLVPRMPRRTADGTGAAAAAVRQRGRGGDAVKEPRHRLVVEDLSVNDVASLAVLLAERFEIVENRLQKRLVRNLRRACQAVLDEHDAWRRAVFFCAGKPRRKSR